MVALAGARVVVVVAGCGRPFFGFLFCFLLALFGLCVKVDAASVVVVVVVVASGTATAGMVAMMMTGAGPVCGTVAEVGDGAVVGGGTVVGVSVVVGVVVGGVDVVGAEVVVVVLGEIVVV